MVTSRLVCECREYTSNKRRTITAGLHRIRRGEPVDIGELIGDLSERPVHRDVPQCLFGPEPLMDQIVAAA